MLRLQSGHTVAEIEPGPGVITRLLAAAAHPSGRPGGSDQSGDVVRPVSIRTGKEDYDGLVARIGWPRMRQDEPVIRSQTTTLGRWLAFALLGLWLFPDVAQADEFGRGPLFYPASLESGAVRVAAGAVVDVLPRRLVEAELREVPRLTGSARIGLPYGFSLDLRLSAIVVANEAQLGAAWGRRIGPVSFVLQDHFGFWFGTLGYSGFDATAWGMVHTPGIVVGLPMDRVFFSLGWELLLLHGRHVSIGEASLDERRLSNEGFAWSLLVENLLDRGHVIYYGATVLYARPDYQLWLAFSDSNQKQFFPRFVAGYEF
jgi:hypothetical protein